MPCAGAASGMPVSTRGPMLRSFTRSRFEAPPRRCSSADVCGPSARCAPPLVCFSLSSCAPLNSPQRVHIGRPRRPPWTTSAWAAFCAWPLCATRAPPWKPPRAARPSPSSRHEPLRPTRAPCKPPGLRALPQRSISTLCVYKGAAQGPPRGLGWPPLPVLHHAHAGTPWTAPSQASWVLLVSLHLSGCVPSGGRPGPAEVAPPRAAPPAPRPQRSHKNACHSACPYWSSPLSSPCSPQGPCRGPGPCWSP